MFDSDFVFLSPHRDDVCFSLGSLARITSGTLINLFTRSQYTPTTVNDFSAAIIDRVSALRHAEDRAFMSMCGLHEIDLHWSEAPLRGYDPFDGNDLGPEVSCFAPQLRQTLDALSRPASRLKPWLFCPIGIGGHRDHLIVRNALLSDLADLERRFSVAFYEDLPYASQPDRRDSGIADFAHALGSFQFQRKALPLGRHADVKLRMVRLYESQFEASPTTLARYTPAVSGAEPHEAIWARRELSRDLRLWLRRLTGLISSTRGQ
jgi:LmbE family N-acetylglucosaminyl deacetylase